MKTCRRCVLTEAFPRITFGPKGVCSVCRQEQSFGKSSSQEKFAVKNEWQALLSTAVKKRGYQALVCFSGGKDSAYALYQLHRRGLKVLAWTLDNGFIAADTRANIRRVTDRLRIDHIFCKPPTVKLNRIFRKALKINPFPEKSIERGSSVCLSCIGLVKYASLRVALDENIGLIAFGWSPGQIPSSKPFLKLEPAMLETMLLQTRQALKKLSPEGWEAYLPSKFLWADRTIPQWIYPSAMERYNEDKIYKILSKIGWQKPQGLDLNSSNCILNSLNVQNHIERYGFHPYTDEIARLVRRGFLSRREGLRRVMTAPPRATVELAEKLLGRV